MTNYNLAYTGAQLSAMLKNVPLYCVGTGVANTYAVTLPITIDDYFDGLAVSVLIPATNTGASTLNVNTKGAIPMLSTKGEALIAGKLTVDCVYTLIYSGGSFTLQAEGSEYGTATADKVLTGYTIGTDSGIQNGTMVDRTSGSYLADALAVGGNSLYLSVPDSAFYGDSANIYATDTDWIEGNIKVGVDLFGKTGSFTGIKSVQYFTITIATSATSGTATISAVVTDNSIIIQQGSTSSDTTAPYGAYFLSGLTLTNTTTITATRGVASASYTATVHGMIIEFESGVVKSKQASTFPMTATATTKTITSVDKAKTMLICSGYTSPDATASLAENELVRITLTDATTITATVGLYSSSYDVTVYYNLLEFN